MIREELLHYLWRTKNFNHSNLATSDGQAIQILNYGYLNPSDGPDFLEAKIKIDNVEWNGAVEIHIKSSDWSLHGHQNDDNYKKTILHVVFENDREIKFSNEEKVPCLELAGRISKAVVERYQTFNNAAWVPCEQLISEATEISIFSTKEQCLSERFERRLSAVASLGEQTANNWEVVAYRLLLRSFGLVHNADAFLEIAKRLPLNIIKKNSDSIFKIESLLFGVSGLLDEDFKDNYPERLKKEYEFLSQKYGLKKEGAIPIKFKAVRPQNFATIRLSQFAQVISKDHILDKLITSSIKEIETLLNVATSAYWANHYTFDKISSTKKKKIGKSKIQVLIINGIVPFLFFLGKTNDDETLVKRAYDFLENLPSEKNSILSKWKNLNLSSKNAFDSQALLELKKNMCDKKLCLSCPIGHSIIKKS